LFRDCAQGKGVVAVIRGSIASGKTTLLHAFAEQALAVDAVLLSAVACRAERDLPLGIIEQLFLNTPLPAAISAQVAELARDRTLSDISLEPDLETVSPELGRVFEGLLKSLVELSEDRPVVIAVDDMQYADAASLHWLCYLARRVSSARILIVLTESTHVLPAARMLHAEILRQRNCRCISVAPLSPSGVASLLGESLDGGAAQRLAPWCHAVTGGNPLLVNALVEDIRETAEASEPLPRAAFRSAIVTCLHRYEPGLVELAQAVAVLGENAAPGLLAELLAISAESASHGINALSASGLLESGRFRHEAARDAVLEHMTIDERAAMHARTALTLYKAGTDPATLAGHLLDAHRIDERWTVPVLQEAAERALADQDADRAIAYLRRAETECSDSRQSAAVRLALASAEWPVNPEGAARHLPELVNDAREGRLDSGGMDKLAHYLLWAGDTSNAAEIVNALDLKIPPAGKSGLQAHHIRSPLNLLYPELIIRTRGTVPDARSSPRRAASARPQDLPAPRSGDMAGGEAIADVAERILQERGLNDPTMASVTAALMALISEDLLDRAALWCDVLMRDLGTARGNVLARATLTGFQAMIETRWGDLAIAEEHARTALALLTRKAWGVAIGVPLSSLVLTAIAGNKHAEAAAYLRVPFPRRCSGLRTDCSTSRPGGSTTWPRGARKRLWVISPSAGTG